LVITGGNDGAAKLWETATGKLVRCFCDETAEVRPAAFSSDGKTVLIKRKSTSLWSLASGKLIQSFETSTSADGRFFLQSNEQRRSWTLLEHKTGREVQHFELAGAGDPGGYEGNKFDEAFAPDGRVIAKIERKVVVLYSTITGKELGRCTGHKEDIEAVAFS